MKRTVKQHILYKLREFVRAFDLTRPPTTAEILGMTEEEWYDEWYKPVKLPPYYQRKFEIENEIDETRKKYNEAKEFEELTGLTTGLALEASINPDVDKILKYIIDQERKEKNEIITNDLEPIDYSVDTYYFNHNGSKEVSKIVLKVKFQDNSIYDVAYYDAGYRVVTVTKNAFPFLPNFYDYRYPLMNDSNVKHLLDDRVIVKYNLSHVQFSKLLDMIKNRKNDYDIILDRILYEIKWNDFDKSPITYTYIKNYKNRNH